MPPAQVTEEEAKKQATVFVKEFFAAVGLTETYVAGKSTEELFDGLHTLVKESQNPSAALYTDFQESLEKVIRAGIVRRIVGQMTKFVSLTDNSPIPKDSDPFDHVCHIWLRILHFTIAPNLTSYSTLCGTTISISWQTCPESLQLRRDA